MALKSLQQDDPVRPQRYPMCPDEPPATDGDLSATVIGLSHLAAQGRAHAKASYHEIIAVGVTLLITALGYIWGMRTTAFNFTRAGELIVVTGIVFAGLDLSGRLSLVDEWLVGQLERVRPVILQGWNRKDQEKAQAKIDRREVLEGHVTDDIKVATDKARARLRFIEISILILGSLVCGFGDLVVVHWGS